MHPEGVPTLYLKIYKHCSALLLYILLGVEAVLSTVYRNKKETEKQKEAI